MHKKLYLPNDLFDLFPVEQVKASELVQGDIANIHQRWMCIYSSFTEKKYREDTQTVISLGSFGGIGYLPPDHMITIIQRSIIDQTKVKKLVAMHEAEELEREQWRLEEEREEKARLREMRDQLNRELGED